MDDGLRNLGPNEPSQLSPLSRSKAWVGSARSSRSAFHCLVDLNSVSRHVNFEDGLSAQRLHLGVDIVVTGSGLQIHTEGKDPPNSARIYIRTWQQEAQGRGRKPIIPRR